MEPKDLVNNNLEKKMKFQINYKGEEFNNYVNLTSLNKRLVAVDKVIKVSLKTLIKTKQIKNGKNAIADISIDIQRQSLDHTILVQFLTGINADALGNLIIDYLKYLAGLKLAEFSPNIILTLNKDVSALNQFQSLIHIGNNTSEVHLHFKKNEFKIDSNTNIKIKQRINELKETIDISEQEEIQIGTILRLDTEKDKYIIKLDSGKYVTLDFEEIIDFEDIRPIINKRIVIEGTGIYKNGDMEEFRVKDFRPANKPKSLKDFNKKDNY